MAKGNVNMREAIRVYPNRYWIKECDEKDNNILYKFMFKQDEYEESQMLLVFYSNGMSNKYYYRSEFLNVDLDFITEINSDEEAMIYFEHMIREHIDNTICVWQYMLDAYDECNEVNNE